MKFMIVIDVMLVYIFKLIEHLQIKLNNLKLIALEYKNQLKVILMNKHNKKKIKEIC
jgi:hypothetical protein